MHSVPWLYIFKLREDLYPALLLTVCVDGVEHGHDPLLEGGGEIIVLFTLANVLQRGLELLDCDSAVLFTYKHYHCTFIVSTEYLQYLWGTINGPHIRVSPCWGRQSQKSGPTSRTLSWSNEWSWKCMRYIIIHRIWGRLYKYGTTKKQFKRIVLTVCQTTFFRSTRRGPPWQWTWRRGSRSHSCWGIRYCRGRRGSAPGTWSCCPSCSLQPSEDRVIYYTSPNYYFPARIIGHTNTESSLSGAYTHIYTFLSVGIGR